MQALELPHLTGRRFNGFGPVMIPNGDNHACPACKGDEIDRVGHVRDFDRNLIAEFECHDCEELWMVYYGEWKGEME